MLIWLNLQRDATGKGFSNIKDTFAESLQLQMSVLHENLQSSKIYLSKECRKTSYSNMNYMYVANTAMLKTQNFSWRSHLTIWIFASTGEYFYYWHCGVLLKKLQGKWCQDLQKLCSIILCLVFKPHHKFSK